jgi:hypothetical protein
MLSPFASLSRKSPDAGHSRESGNPARCGVPWTPAYAGVTTPAIFISLGGPQAHEYSLANHARSFARKRDGRESGPRLYLLRKNADADTLGGLLQVTIERRQGHTVPDRQLEIGGGVCRKTIMARQGKNIVDALAHCLAILKN